MPLPGALNEKYLARLQELIDEGESMPRIQADALDLPAGTPWEFVIDSSMFREWQTKVGSVLSQLVPHDSVHRQFVENCVKFAPDVGSLDRMVPRLKGIKDDYVKGLLDDFPLLVRAELAADYLEQATLLFGTGYRVPAAVLAGAVLEDALRQLCTDQGIPTGTGKGKRKTIDPMNTELAKAGVYNAAKAAEIRGWAALRNDAAHGDGDKLDPKAVERMIDGVRSFAGDYLK